MLETMLLRQPEQPPVYPDMTVTEYLKFVTELKSVPRKERAAEVERVIEKTQLQAVRERLIMHLSKGYKQRVGLAQALVGNPKVLILDEPTVGLDPKQIIEIRTLIKKLGKNHTVILSSHILSEVQAVCDRIIIINKGKIVFTEERNEMLEKYRIMKCTEEDLQQVDKKDIIGMRKGRFCSEVLTLNADKYPGMVADAPTIEEIMVYYVKEQQS